MALNRPFSVPLTLPQLPNTGDKKLDSALEPLHIAVYNLLSALDQYTGQIPADSSLWSEVGSSRVYAGLLGRYYAVAGADLLYGAMVRFAISGGALKAFPAQADSITNQSHAWCNTEGGIAVGDYGEFCTTPGLNRGVAGLLAGECYYLSPISLTGQVTNTRPVAPGQIIQPVGVALAAEILLCYPFNTSIVV